MNIRNLCKISDDFESDKVWKENYTDKITPYPANVASVSKSEGRNLTDESQFSRENEGLSRYYLKCTFYDNGTMVEDTNYWCVENSEWDAYTHTLENVQDDMRGGTYADPSWDYEIVITDRKPEDAPSTEAPSTEAPSTEAPSTEAPSTEVEGKPMSRKDVINWLDEGWVFDLSEDADPLVLHIYSYLAFSETIGFVDGVPAPGSYIFSLDFNALTEWGGWKDAVVALGKKMGGAYRTEGMPSVLHKRPDSFKVSFVKSTYFLFESVHNEDFRFYVDIAKLDDPLFNKILKILQ